MTTIIQEQPRAKHDRHQRWARLERADLLERYDDLHSQGLSQRQAAQVLDVPRSTLQAWQTYHDSLDECPTVVAFFHSVPGLAFLHRLVLAIHLVCVEVGAGGIRLVCLLWQLTGVSIALSAPRMGRSSRLTSALRRPSWRTATQRAHGWGTRCHAKIPR